MLRFASALVASALLATATAAGAQTIPQGAAGAAFYVPPSPLPAGRHGDAIWWRPLTTAANLPHASENLLVLYRTISAGDKDVAVTGTVSIPTGTPPPNGWPVITWAHGTTGDAPQCTPSLDAANGPEHSYLGAVEVLLDAFVRRGYAVVQTDYEGQGTPGVHPYLVGVAEAHDVLDVVRAARQLRPSLGARFLVMGHSQGGQSALFAGSLARTWTPELALVGTVALAPASHLVPWLQSLPHNNEPYLGFGFAGLLVRGYASVDPAVRADRIFGDAVGPIAAHLADRCVVGLTESDSWAGVIPARAFRAGADLTPLLRDAAANEPGNLMLRDPVLLLQGTADRTVVPAASDALANELCAHGTTLTYEPLAQATHDGLLAAGLPTTQPWIDARFTGANASSNCGTLPKAVP